MARLVAAGLDSIPGGGAEVLVDRVRKLLHCYGKATADEWLDVMRHAHRAGLRTTATMMYGTVETDEERIEHMLRLRDVQDETGGFTAFITWSFQPAHTELGGFEATGVDYLRTLATARLVLDNFDNLQASWVTQGGKVGQLSLAFGANDMGSRDDRGERRARRRRRATAWTKSRSSGTSRTPGSCRGAATCTTSCSADRSSGSARCRACSSLAKARARRRPFGAGRARQLSRAQPERQAATRRTAVGCLKTGPAASGRVAWSVVRRATSIRRSRPQNGGAHGAPGTEPREASRPPPATEPGCGAEP